jgi:hypothetical protein
VRATNAKGAGAAGASGAIVVGAPAQVGRPIATKVSSGRLRVNFPNLTAAAANGAPLITPKYTATCRSTNGGVAKAATGVGNPIFVGGLSAGKAYACTVFAHNARGNGASSAPSAVRAV